MTITKYSPPQELESGDADQDVAKAVHLQQVTVHVVKPQTPEIPVAHTEVELYFL